MTTEKVNALITQFKNHIPDDQVLILKNSLASASDDCYDNLIALTFKNPTTTLLLSIFLGGLGVDRFYIGDTGLGVCKLLFGWLTGGIWPIVDIFFSYKKTKEKNLNKILSAIN